MLRLARNDLPGFRKACARLLEWAGPNPTPDTALWVAWAGGLLPDSGIEPARAAQGFAAGKAKYGPQSFGMFSCSKSTNEMNYAAQKFARVVMGSNNIDRCNRT